MFRRRRTVSFHSYLLAVCVLSCVRLFAISWTVAPQVSLSMEFSRQEYWIGLPFPPPGDLSDPGIKSASAMSLALAGGFFPTAPPGKPFLKTIFVSSCALQAGRNVPLPLGGEKETGRRKSVIRAALQACLCHPVLEEKLSAYRLVRREVWVSRWSETLSLDSRWQEGTARNSVVPSTARSGQREKPQDQRGSVGKQGSDPDTHHVLFLFPEQPLPSFLFEVSPSLHICQAPLSQVQP